MKHRTFLKTLAASAASFIASGHRGLLGEDKLALPPYKTTLPTTPFNAPEGSWTFVVLPDTQYYSQKYPEVFERQTQWIAAHKDSHKILFVAHEGDITNNNNAEQWERAQKAVRVLNEARVPYALAPGNHDLGTNGKADNRSSLMSDYFKPADYQNSKAHVLFETGKMENSVHRFDSPTGSHMVVALEFGPRDEVLTWAGDQIAAHPDHQVTVVTHAYLFSDNLRNDWTTDGPAKHRRGNPKAYGLFGKGTVNDGEEIWRKLAEKNANVRLILNGHITSGNGTGRLDSQGEAGQTVYQLLANYQDNSPKSAGTVMPARGYGGGGFLRLMQYHPDGKTISVKTYSPWYDQWLEEDYQQFDLKLA